MKFITMLKEQLHNEFPEINKKTILGLAALITGDIDDYPLEEVFNCFFEEEYPSEKFSDQEMTAKIYNKCLNKAKENINNPNIREILEKRIPDIYDEVFKKKAENKRSETKQSSESTALRRPNYVSSVFDCAQLQENNKKDENDYMSEIKRLKI